MSDIVNFHSLIRVMTDPFPRMNSIATGIREAMRILCLYILRFRQRSFQVMPSVLCK